ncbi:hypothetical protein G6L37_05690 [Agrobacterium rubi]|nr:hypothetical protein [Agrobacterium rubi]NTF24851.1 hypothetical protein [Agrobacterium rubi]
MNAVVAPAPKFASAILKLKELGLSVGEPDSSIIAPLMTSLAEIDDAKAFVVSRTLAHQDVFSAMVSKEVSQMTIGDRQSEIAANFKSIINDMKSMVGQAERGSPSVGERFGNIYMKITRGDVAYRFDLNEKTFKEVIKDSLAQIEREKKVLDAYLDYRGALKEAEVLIYDLMKIAAEQLEAAKQVTSDANAAVIAAAAADPAERAKLELARDDAQRLQTAAEGRWQSAKRQSENLSSSYNIADMTFKRLEQITNIKQEGANEASAFFSTNKIVFAALKVTMTGFLGLHELTQSINEMKSGRADAIEALASVGDKLLQDATTTAYTSTDDGTVAAMKTLISATENWTITQKKLAEEARIKSTENTAMIAKDAEATRQAIIAASA